MHVSSNFSFHGWGIYWYKHGKFHSRHCILYLLTQTVNTFFKISNSKEMQEMAWYGLMVVRYIRHHENSTHPIWHSTFSLCNINKCNFHKQAEQNKKRRVIFLTFIKYNSPSRRDDELYADNCHGHHWGQTKRDPPLLNDSVRNTRRYAFIGHFHCITAWI